MLTLPTGWLYDLGVGVGTEQGQRPAEGVSLLRLGVLLGLWLAVTTVWERRRRGTT